MALKINYRGFLERLREASPELRCGQGSVAENGGLGVFYDFSGDPNSSYSKVRISVSVNFYDDRVYAKYERADETEYATDCYRINNQQEIKKEYEVANALRGACVKNKSIYLVIREIIFPRDICRYFNFITGSPEIPLEEIVK